MKHVHLKCYIMVFYSPWIHMMSTHGQSMMW